MNDRITVEIAVDSLEDAVAAQQGGAHRLELCADLAQDGLSPSRALLAAVRAAVSIPVFVMVRPRAGGFQYSDEEAAEMARQIEHCRQEGADGIVLGLLDTERNIDTVRTRKLIGLAAPLPVTFHRAFDAAAEPFHALERIIACGATRLLTSGQKETAISGIGTIRALTERANGRIIILPGAGIDASNAKELSGIPGITEIHLSKGVKRKDARGALSVDPRLVESFIAGVNA